MEGNIIMLHNVYVTDMTTLYDLKDRIRLVKLNHTWDDKVNERERNE